MLCKGMVQSFAPAKAVVVLGVTLAALGFGAPSALAATPQLTAKFDINLTFTMATGSGAPLGSPSPPGQVIPAGTYMLSVDDTAEIGYMTYVLQGPGVAVRTTNEEGAQDYESFEITLQP